MHRTAATDGLERGTVVALGGDPGGAKSFTAQDDDGGGYRGPQPGLGKKPPRYGLVDRTSTRRTPSGSSGTASGYFRSPPSASTRARVFYRLGVRLGAGRSDWSAWPRCELQREPADLLAIDTGIAATAPEVKANDAVAGLYTEHLYPLAARDRSGDPDPAA